VAKLSLHTSLSHERERNLFFFRISPFPMYLFRHCLSNQISHPPTYVRHVRREEEVTCHGSPLCSSPEAEQNCFLSCCSEFPGRVVSVQILDSDPKNCKSTYFVKVLSSEFCRDHYTFLYLLRAATSTCANSSFQPLCLDMEPQF
jgi:hypothetical protein